MQQLLAIAVFVSITLIGCAQKNQTFNKEIQATAGINTLYVKFPDGTMLYSKPVQLYPEAGIAISTGSAWGPSIVNNSVNWNTAYSWGNHAGLYEPKLGNPTTNGYVLSSTTAGVRSWVPMTGSMVYPSAGIPVSTGSAWGTSIVNNSANWNTAYSWGNHSGLYRPITWVPTWADVTGKPTFATVATSGLFADLLSKPTTIAGYGITNAMTTSHPANVITATNITNWNSAYSWGNHSGLYRPVAWVPSWTDVTGKPTTFAPIAHTHDWTTDITNKPPTQQLIDALLSLGYTPIPGKTTTEINAITPTAGSFGIVYDTTIGSFKIWTGTAWEIVILSGN